MENRAEVPDLDDFDRKLREVTSGGAGSARYREPSAVERAKLTTQPGHRARVSWRNARRSRMLRKPVTVGNGGRTGSRRGWQPTRPRRGRLSAIRRPAAGSRRKQLRSFAKGAGILAGFVALLFLMHMLGFGPH